VQGPHPEAPPLGCGHGGTYTLIHSEMEWIESSSGYDITPCFDADGTWNPSEGCTGFPTELRGFAGAWAQLCEGATMSGPSEMCGQGIGEPDPPEGDTGDASGSGGTSMGEGGTPPPSGSADASTSEPLGESSGDPSDEDDDDPGQNESGPQSLPPTYGRSNAIAGCRVGEPSGVLLLLLLLVRVRRSAPRCD
jgi:hypothetical protein